MDALTDEMPSVSREAQKALTARIQVGSGERLWEMFQAARLPHVKRNALFLLAHLHKWDSIYFLIKAVRDPDEEIESRSQHYAQRWLKQFNRGFSIPTQEQLSKIRRAIDECGARLGESTREQLLFSLKGF
jgi:hypothetical protein